MPARLGEGLRHHGSQGLGFSPSGEGVIRHSSRLNTRNDLADLAGGGRDAGARNKRDGFGPVAVAAPRRSSPRRAAEFISGGDRPHGLIGDHPVYPEVDAFSRELTDGYGEKIGPIGIYATDQGEQELLDSQIEGIQVVDPDWITTGNWGAGRLDGVVGLPRRLDVNRVSRRGVEIAHQAIDASGKKNGETLVALTLCPPGDTGDGIGTLSRGESRRRFYNQATRLVEAARARSDIPFFLFFEAGARLIDAGAFAEVAQELEVPYGVAMRPDKLGRVRSGESYRQLADEIGHDLLRLAGWTCANSGDIVKAAELAQAEGTDIFTYAAPNGSYGKIEDKGRELNDEELWERELQISRDIRTLNGSGVDNLASCCNGIVPNVGALATWARRPRDGSASNLRPWVAGPTESLGNERAEQSNLFVSGSFA